MPEWVPFAVVSVALTGVVFWVVVVVLLTIAACRALARLFGRDQRQDVGMDPRTGLVWAACHSTRCGHLQTEHEELETGGLQCTRCLRIVPAP
ncbi:MULTISPECIES: hypothetical protein [unclassified Streptomyces]|uniref:hypothetical protein n=1 Tax=unclassified Streptomyces TaxID=2593676 RepID=UPI00382C00C8